MINVLNNQSNILALTLSEAINDVSISGSTVATSGFTMSLENITTRQTFTGITLTDTSDYTTRYNQFTLTLTGLTQQDYSTSKIYLKDNGYYMYQCYYNLDELSEEIEVGFFKVIGATDVIPVYKYTGTDNDDIFQYGN